MEKVLFEIMGAWIFEAKFFPQAINELRYLLGEDAISTDHEGLVMHGYSEWSSINIKQLPDAVAYPKSTEEVSQIAKICHKYRVPMSMYWQIQR